MADSSGTVGLLDIALTSLAFKVLKLGGAVVEH
jgi:hypothetical protein